MKRGNQEVRKQERSFPRRPDSDQPPVDRSRATRAFAAPAAALGLPGAQEGEDIFGSHGAGGFKFAAFLGEKEFAVGIEDSDGRDAAIERDTIFFGDVQILVHFANVDVNDNEELVEGGSDFGRVKGFVENVAIEAPVAAKDDQDAFAEGDGGLEGFGDFFGGIGASGIDVPLLERLAKACRKGVSRRQKQPFGSLIKPALDHGDVFPMRRGTGLVGERELQDQNVDVGLWVLLLGDFGGKVDESFGFKSGPESDFVRKRDGILLEVGDLGGGRLRVQAFESGGIARKDSRAPLVEGWEGGRSVLAGGDAGRQKRQEHE